MMEAVGPAMAARIARSIGVSLGGRTGRIEVA
jgi:hypothetical protein